MKLFLGLLLFLFISCESNPVDKVKKVENNQPKKRIENKLDWIELSTLDKSFVYEMRYATTNNFVQKKMYPCTKCFVRPEVAHALVSIQKELKKRNFKLKIFDCYRPGSVQKKLWKIKPDHRYVADPKKGSMHNRGLAVDVTIVDENGNELDMGTPFDYFGKKAYHNYKQLPDTVLKNRMFLKKLMQKYDMMPITSEWWHYSYRKKTYPVEDWIWTCN